VSLLVLVGGAALVIVIVAVLAWVAMSGNTSKGD
jgi:hypothetical protein